MTDLLLRVERDGAGRVWLLAPTVGLVRDLPVVGAVVGPGPRAGLEQLGGQHRLLVPEGIEGRVAERAVPVHGKVPVGHGTRLLALETRVTASATAPGEADAQAAAELVFRAPMSGRFYSRPAPDKAPIASVGDVITLGTPLCLLEVMKTFNRVTYGGASAPERARIVRIVPADGEDVTRGAPLFELSAD